MTVSAAGTYSSRDNDLLKSVETPEVLQVSWHRLKVILGLWAVFIVLNYATGRHYRFALAMGMWAATNLILVLFGQGMFDVFLFLILPSVLLGSVDYFGFIGIRVDMYYLIPAVNLIPYCFSGALGRYYPDRRFLSKQFPLVPQVALFVFTCIIATFPSHVTHKTEALRLIGLIFVLPVFFYVYSVHVLSRVENIKQVSVVLVSFASYYAVTLGVLQSNMRGTFAKIVRNLVLYPNSFLESMWVTMFKESKITSIYPDSACFGHILTSHFPLRWGCI